MGIIPSYLLMQYYIISRPAEEGHRDKHYQAIFRPFVGQKEHFLCVLITPNVS